MDWEGEWKNGQKIYIRFSDKLRQPPEVYLTLRNKSTRVVGWHDLWTPHMSMGAVVHMIEKFLCRK